MVRHTIELVGDAAKGARISARVLQATLEPLIQASQRALRRRVEGRSHLRGDTSWLDAAADFDLLGFRSGSTVVELEALPLSQAAPDIYAKLPLWDDTPRPEQSAIGVLQETLNEAVQGNAESDWLDRAILESVAGLNRLLSFGFQQCALTSTDRSPSVVITQEGLSKAERLYEEAPSPRRVLMTGYLDQLTNSRRTFALRLNTGVVRGILPPGEVAEFGSLWGRRVVVDGEAQFRPSGRISVLVALSVRPATDADSVWEQFPRPQPRTVDDLRPRNPLSPGMSGFGRVYGRWPGEETDEEINAALEALS